MISSLKSSGLILVVALAVTAAMPSSASAFPNGKLVGSHHFVAHDTEGANNAFTSAAGIECSNATYTGTLTNEGRTLHLTPEFSDCATSTGAPVTPTHSGCKIVLHIGTKISATPLRFRVSLTEECPSPLVSWIKHIYTNVTHSSNACTIEIPAQDPPDELEIEDETDGHLRVLGVVTEIENYLSGPCVGGGTVAAPDATLHVDMTLTGGLEIEDE